MNNINILQEIVKNSVLELLTEAALSVDDFYAIAQKKYGENYVDFSIFKNAVTADPTARKDVKTNEWNKGKYGEWISKNLRDADFVKLSQSIGLHNMLGWYDTHKQLLNDDIAFDYADGFDSDKVFNYQDINSLPWDFLYKLYRNLKDTLYTQKEIKSQCDIPLNTSEWMIVMPKTKAASQYYGAGAKWCTAATTSFNMFNRYYSEESPLYINIDKRRDKKDPLYKCQFYWDDSSLSNNEFKNALNEEIEQPVEETLDMPENVREWYSSKGLEFKSRNTDEELLNMIEEDSELILNIGSRYLYLRQDEDSVYEDGTIETDGSASYYLYDEDGRYYYDASFSKDSVKVTGEHFVILNDSVHNYCVYIDSKTQDWVIEELANINRINLGGNTSLFVMKADSSSLLIASMYGRVFVHSLPKPVDVDYSNVSNFNGTLFLQVAYDDSKLSALINLVNGQICIKGDIPADGKLFQCDENGLIKGKKALYNLNGDIVEEYSASYAVIEGKSLLEGCELVEIIDPNNETFSRYFNYLSNGKLLFKDNFTKQHKISKTRSAFIADYTESEYANTDYTINYADGIVFPTQSDSDTFNGIHAWNDCGNGNIVFSTYGESGVYYYNVEERKSVIENARFKHCSRFDKNSIAYTQTVDGEWGFLTSDNFYPIPNATRITHGGVVRSYYCVQMENSRFSIFSSDDKKFVLQNVYSVSISDYLGYPLALFYLENSKDDDLLCLLPSSNITLSFGKEAQMFGDARRDYGNNYILCTYCLNSRLTGYILNKTSGQLVYPNKLENIKFIIILKKYVLAQESNGDEFTYALYDVAQGKKLTEQIITRFDGMNMFSTINHKQIRLEDDGTVTQVN